MIPAALDEERKASLNTLWEKIKHSALIQSVLIVGLCLAVYWIGPISTWETNDDVYYNLLFSGQLVTSAPNPHAVMVNFVLSSLFTQLYTFAPSIPWYGYFHVTALLLSVWFLNYCYALVHGNDKFPLRIVLSLLSVLPLLFFLQFTKTAAALAVAGYLGLYLLNQASISSQRQILMLHACATVLLVLAFTLRRDSFLLITLLCGLLLASALLKRKRAILVTLATVFVLILSVSLVHKLNYGDEWQNFFAMGRATGPIIDFNQYSYNENQKAYSDVGLSKNDYYFFRSWGYSDNSIYNPERFDRILATATKIAQQRNPLATLQGAISFPARNYFFTAVGLSLLMLLVCRPQYRFLFFYVFLPLLICTGILAWQGRFPTRVSTTLFFFLPWAVLVLCGEMRKRLFVGGVSLVALIALAIPVYGQHQDLANIAKYRLAQNQDLHRLGASLSSTPITLVNLGAAFPYEGMLPFESFTYLEETRHVWLCGMNQSPVQKKQLADNNIKDLFSLLSDGTTAYIVLDAGVIRILKQYIFEHYQRNVNVSPVFIGKSFTVYRVSS